MSMLHHLQNTRPEISVIIPAFNEELYIAKTLEALAKNHPGFPTEVLVIDNASLDNTQKIAEKYGAKVIRESTKGVSYARQTGLDAAKGNIILWTDADSLVGENWIWRHRAGFEDKQLMAQSAHIEFDETMHWSFKTYTFVAAQVKKIIGYQKLGPLCTGGANMSFRKDVAEKVGGFELGSDAGEDQILFSKLLPYGKVIINQDPELAILTSGRRWSSSSRTYAHMRQVTQKFNQIGITKGVGELGKIQKSRKFEDYR